MTHADNVYKIPNYRAVGRVCRTNLPPNTAFRGFGGPQGMIITEQWMERVAEFLKLPSELVCMKPQSPVLEAFWHFVCA